LFAFACFAVVCAVSRSLETAKLPVKEMAWGLLGCFQPLDCIDSIKCTPGVCLIPLWKQPTAGKPSHTNLGKDSLQLEGTADPVAGRLIGLDDVDAGVLIGQPAAHGRARALGIKKLGIGMAAIGPQSHASDHISGMTKKESLSNRFGQPSVGSGNFGQ
jgi:hypothetical protein